VPQASAWAPRSSTRDARLAGGLGITIKYLRHTTSGAAGNSLGTTIKYLRGAASIGLGTTIKYPRRKTRQRPGSHDQVLATHNERRRRKRPGRHEQVPAAHNERRRGQRLEPIPGLPMCPFTTSAPRSPLFVRASVANK
jgi:hypothetical protein